VIAEISLVASKHPSRGQETRSTSKLRGRNPRELAASDRGQRHPVLVAFSADLDVVQILSRAIPEPWIIEAAAPTASREALSNPAVRMVVVDDTEIDESSRGWLLDQIRKLASHALIAYIASSHNEENERRARSYQVQFYTSRPLDHERTLRMIRSFANAAR